MNLSQYLDIVTYNIVSNSIAMFVGFIVGFITGHINDTFDKKLTDTEVIITTSLIVFIGWSWMMLYK